MAKLIRRRLPLVVLAGALVLPFATSGAAKDCGGAVACACGDRVVSSVALGVDLNNCADDGLIVAAGVLDCAGRQIAGPGDRTDAVGVLVRGFTGAGADLAEVRNCRIRNFGKGIEIDSGTGNVLANNAVFSNEIGIWLGDGATDSRVEDNHVRDNRDEGIHIGGGVVGTVVERNTLVNNRRENLYLISSSGAIVRENVIDNSDAAAILLKHADDNQFVGNTILQRNVLVRGDSSGNVFTDNEIVSGYFHFEAIEEDDTWSYPSGNTVSGGIMRKASTCFEFSGAFDNSASGVLVDTCKPKEEKERGGVEPHDNPVDVVRMDLGEHSSPGRRHTGNLRMSRSPERDRFSFDVRNFLPHTPIDPLHEDVHCTLSDWQGLIIDVLVPAGSLVPRGQGARLVDRDGTFGGLRRLDLRAHDDGTWRLKMTGRGNASGADYPIMTLRCQIGDDVLSYSDFWKATSRGWSLREQ